MKSTGEVMGGAATFGSAFAKAQLAAGQRLPSGGAAFISVNNHDKPAVVQIARDLRDIGFKLVATRGTANYLRAHGVEAEIVFKVNEGRPHVGDEILNNHIHLVINTPLGRESFFDDRTVRRIAMMHGVPCITTLTGAAATVNAIKAIHSEGLTVRALQEYHAGNCHREGLTPAQNLRAPARGHEHLRRFPTRGFLQPRVECLPPCCWRFRSSPGRRPHVLSIPADIRDPPVGAALLALIAAIGSCALDDRHASAALIVVAAALAGLSLGVSEVRRVYRTPLASWFEAAPPARPSRCTAPSSKTRARRRRALVLLDVSAIETATARL